MATLAAGFGASHSLMLVAELQDWLTGFRSNDHKMPYFDRTGKPISYADVLAKAPADAAGYITDELITRRFNEVHAAMEKLRADIIAARLDALVIVGDDQSEIFDKLNMPSIGIYYGDKILNVRQPEPPSGDWFKRAQDRRLEPGEDRLYPIDSGLALHLIHGLRDRDFDIAAIGGLRPDQHEGHAYSFIHRFLMPGLDIATIPIFLNTWNPPNQATPKRCVKLGEALAEAVASYPKDIRVGVIASGGLSHFVVDEEMDQAIIDALRADTPEVLGEFDPEWLKAGSSEIRNWIIVAGAMRGRTLDWISYTPAYRSPALTGTGLCFATWH